MSGHSKWANIKHKKGKSDALRGKIFTKIGREIAVAVKAGGPDPSINSKLYDVIVKARANNMPNDNIQRSIKKASELMGLPAYYLRRLCKEVPGLAFQSGVKWYINLGKLAEYYNNIQDKSS